MNVRKGQKIRIVKFGTSAETFPFIPGEKIDAAVKIGVNLYNGREYLSIQAVDIRKSGMNEDAYFAQKEEYELFLAEKIIPKAFILTGIYAPQCIKRFAKGKMFIRMQTVFIFHCLMLLTGR